jgi:hypothetical protein
VAASRKSLSCPPAWSFCKDNNDGIF